MTPEKLIKPKSRVKDRREVFTAEREVNAMLNLLLASMVSKPR